MSTQACLFLRITLPFTQTLIFKPGPCACSRLLCYNLAHLPPISGYIHTFSLLSQEYLAIISLQGLALLPPIHLAKDYSSLNVKLTPVQFYQRILISQCQTHTSSILHSKRVEAMSVFFLIVYPVSGI